MKILHQGFTLVELMVTLAIFSVLVGLGFPSMQHLVRSSKITSVNNALVSALQLARSEAIKRNREVIVCSAKGGVMPCRDGNSWSSGWIVFVDESSELLRSYPLDTESGVSVMTDSDYPLPEGIAFQRQGYPVIPNSTERSAAFGSFLICEDASESKDFTYTRNIVVKRSGRIKTTGKATKCSG